ncbi:hypothetical protein ACT3CD_00220 [Geofilum sp. OHC36d9]|uniref:hypothetical protein n=1 Tax=Geofilum sp. OHC36d9 TaxID=3458413 RepID=UPI004033914C
MKNFIILLTLVIVTGLFSCENDKYDRIDFTADKNLCQIFTDIEIENIASMVDFVDSAVVSITNNKNVADAYHDFFEIYGESLQEGKRIVPFIEKKNTIFFKA